MVAGTRWDGLSAYFRNHLGNSHAAVSRVYTEWCEKQNTFSEHQDSENTVLIREIRENGEN